MLNRRLVIAAIAAASSLVAAVPVAAAETAPFTPQAFAAAQKSGKPILVEITAPWCPTCKAQKPILGALLAQPAFKDMAVFDVDFDSQKDAVRGFGARMQSTLIAFKGGTEVGRSVGDTQAGSIKDLVGKAL